MEGINMNYKKLLKILNQIDTFNLECFLQDECMGYSNAQSYINSTYLLNIIEKYMLKVFEEIGFDVTNKFFFNSNDLTIKRIFNCIFLSQDGYDLDLICTEEILLDNVGSLEQYYSKVLDSKHIIYDYLDSGMTDDDIAAFLGEDHLEESCFKPLADFVVECRDDDEIYYSLGFFKSSSLKDYFDYRDKIEDCIEKQILNTICDKLTKQIAFYHPCNYGSLFENIIISKNYIYQFFPVSYTDLGYDSSPLNLFNVNLFIPLYFKIFDYLIEYFNQKYHFIKSQKSVINLTKQSA